ncbi:MAG: gamma carbonic anhydrase family protein [Aeromicrobium sp.]|uniref:gamma carbonic anhydrase family protein n=1 Tax=Aeromicrobium sp. TaxID=1871063 RepID=UPI0039E49992
MLIDLGEGRRPLVPESAFVAPNASLVGTVVLGEGASIWYSAVLRADNEPITVGKDSNVQDGCAFHVDRGQPLVLGEGVSVGHNAVVHGATVGDHCLIGMGAVVMNGAVIGAESLIAAGALVTEGMRVPPRSLVAGVPGKVRRELSDDEVARLHRNARIYTEHRELHRAATVVGATSGEGVADRW